MTKRITTSRKRTWQRRAGKLAVALALGLGAAPAGALSISLGPPTVTPLPGDSFAIELNVAGLGDGAAPSLGAFDVRISFDPGALAFTSVAFDDRLGAIPAQAFADFVPGTGTLDLASFSLLSPAALDSLQPGSFRLATIVFEAVGASPSTIEVESVLLGDGFGQRLALDAPPTGVQVQPIPEPVAALLFGLGVAIVASSQRRRAVS